MGILNYFLSEKVLLKYKYKRRIGKKLDLKHPITFNEKMQWLKLNERTPLHTMCADKYAVRDYIKIAIGEKYLKPLLHHTQNVDDIKPENLPDAPFVIKTNHDSQGSIIVKDKTEANWKEIRKKIKHKMSRNYYYTSGEWQYKHIKPMIIVEKLLEDKNGLAPEYNMHCFNGKVQLISGKIDKNARILIYDLDWKMQPRFMAPNPKKIKPEHSPIDKPETLNEMVFIAEKLASPFSYARIDFYEIDKKIYFGEITFHHIGGFNPFIDEKTNIKFGKMIKLPCEKNK